jgi:hypothetical protein
MFAQQQATPRPELYSMKTTEWQLELSISKREHCRRHETLFRELSCLGNEFEYFHRIASHWSIMMYLPME